MLKTIKNFINLETSSSKLLLLMTILALVLSNSPGYTYYEMLFHTPLSFRIGTMEFQSDLLFWVNEVFMTVFFLVVGLEIKYELLEGALNSLQEAFLPGIAAIGGMIIPAIIYLYFNAHNTDQIRGWAIPTATDIAFSLSILSLLGKKIPASLKPFLMALAIFDDLAAIIVIAIFYTSSLSLLFLGLSLVFLCLLLIFNLIGIYRIFPYIIASICLWVCLLKSGIHPTIAGVILAFSIPLYHQSNSQHSPLQKLKTNLHPWVAFGVLPLFAFANAGVSFIHLTKANIQLSITFGILFGLFLGKQLGVFCASWIAVQLRIAKLPIHIKWLDIYGVAILCGIGFTISIFIGDLAFGTGLSSSLDSVKIGVLLGSLVSGIFGYLLLAFLHRSKN
ncbi:MAG: Na+/H+ antiporter NhaA [Proteobacteria bacterium]|nr:Na+/H+ antiporter NhaA [Pseudomonadota bacterium]